MVTGEVEVDLTALKMVTKLIVRKDKTSTVNVDQFSLAYIVDAERLVYTDYPNISPVQTVSCMVVGRDQIIACLSIRFRSTWKRISEGHKSFFEFEYLIKWNCAQKV